MQIQPMPHDRSCSRGCAHPFRGRRGRRTRGNLAVLWVFAQTLLAVVSPPVGGFAVPRAEALAFKCPHAWPLRRAFIAYDAPSIHYSDELLDYLASRFEFTDEINAYNLQQLKQRNPRFYALTRNSLSDNFVPPAAASLTREHEWFFAHASDYGVDPEDMYLHFWTDTEIMLEGQLIFIPGWQPGGPKYGAMAAP